MNLRTFITLLSILGLLASCARSPKKPSTQAEHRYSLQGVVTRLDPATHTATIRHGRIQDAAGKIWMEPMTMDFPMPENREFAILKVGQQIEGTVFTRDDGLEYWLGEIRVQSGH